MFCRNGWASTIVVDTGYTDIHHSKYWPIIYDTIKERQNKDNNNINNSHNKQTNKQNNKQTDKQTNILSQSPYQKLFKISSTPTVIYKKLIDFAKYKPKMCPHFLQCHADPSHIIWNLTWFLALIDGKGDEYGYLRNWCYKLSIAVVAMWLVMIRKQHWSIRILLDYNTPSCNVTIGLNNKEITKCKSWKQTLESWFIMKRLMASHKMHWLEWHVPIPTQWHGCWSWELERKNQNILFTKSWTVKLEARGQCYDTFFL